MQFITFFVFVLSYCAFSIESSKIKPVAINGTPGKRIIGGDRANAGQFPFAAAIDVKTPNSQYFCGGSLVERQWILTSAQCIYGATQFTVHLGSNTLKGNDPNRISLATSNSVVHPNYDPTTYEHDIGLIKLHMPVTFSEYVRPTLLPIGDRLEPGTLTTAIGWGQTNDDSPVNSNYLKHVELTVLSNEECKMSYGDQVKHDMVCLSGNYNEGTCRGDSGSPLFMAIKNFNFAWQVGIASFLSGNGCESTDPSGYTRTFPYIEWITNVTQNHQ